ncbi:MAG: HipA domain-containing protein [Planctomycetes bacterium]|nr:HipA domain-containing protein [Planctomycetota bacterium]
MNMRDLKHVDRADVWKADHRAAVLVREENGITFRYRDTYEGPPVATSLPLTPQPMHTRGGAVLPFFAGLLPEGRRLTAIQRAVKSSADDELTQLLAVGSDTIGDVMVLPADVEPCDLDSDDDAGEQPLDDCSFEELFASVISTNPADRVGLPGVQDKVSGRLLTLPVRYHDASWILKIDPPAYPHLVANEAFFLAAARACGLPCANAEVIQDREGKAGLLVERFDRVWRRGVPGKLAQEDACQVLGVYPADKYRVSTEDVIRALSERCLAPIVASRELIRQFAFAYVTCNGDAHAKNFSIVHDGSSWMPTPAYDVPSTHPYGDTTMALRLQGKDREDIGRRDFIALGETCGVRQKAIEHALDELVGRVGDWIARIDELPFDARKKDKLSKACTYRINRLSGH